MPRMTRASERASKPMAETDPPNVSRESTSSWQVPTEEELDSARSEDPEADDGGSDPEAESEEDPFATGNDHSAGTGFGVMSAQQFLQPLQQTADRVSRQVEEFAKCLDKFNESRSPTEQSLWQDAGRLLGKYSEIATMRKKQATVGQQGSRASSRNRQSLGDGENEIHQVQLEADLWTLMGSLLDCRSPKALADVKEAQKTALESLHRYSTDVEIWTAFISSDTFAQECQEILGWLQKTAAASKTTIDQVISELTGKAQRGDGIWSAGWLFTKMTIKNQKRSRSWPKPLEPSDAGLDVSLRRASDSKPLVAQMDPDARTREGNALELPDEFHEKAAWQACWETLRRGLNLEKSRAWWLERKEVWRAASTRGADPEFVKHKDSPWFRIINLASNTEWFERCRVLSQDGVVVNFHQAAVYGVLSGDITAPLKVCHTIDDHLFAHFNGLLVQQYQEFLRAYRRKLEKRHKEEYHPQTPTYESVRKYLVYAETDPETKAESRSPHKTIEAAVVSNDFEAFFLRQGQALGQIPDVKDIYLDLLVQDQHAPVSEAAQATAENPDSLRMIVHLQLLLKALGYLDIAYQNSTDVMENSIAAYIGWLENQGKFALTPLYASKLSPERAARTMGAIALDITDPAERDLQVKLMTQYEINLPDVLDAQFMFANADLLALFTTKPSKLKPVSITEYVGSSKVKNIKVRRHFMGDDLQDSEERAVQSLEWYQYADKHEWGRACWNASSLYKMYIFQGRLIAAKALSVRAPLADISKLALGIDLGSPDSLAEASDDDVEMDGVPYEERSQPISPNRRRKGPKRSGVHFLKSASVTREALAAKAQTWRQLEQLMSAMDMLEVWADHADDVEQARDSSPVDVRRLKKNLTASLNEVREHMFPVLEQDYLSQPMDDSEAAFLDEIRRWYLPEIILAYNSVLYFAGHAISRSWLVECMSLAQIVATNSTLIDAFVESGRMRELVSAFALSSQALLHANEAGGKKGKRDTGIDIWQVKYDDARETVLD